MVVVAQEKKKAKETPVAEAPASASTEALRKVIEAGREVYRIMTAYKKLAIRLRMETKDRGDRAAELSQLYSYLSLVNEYHADALKQVAGLLDELKTHGLPEAYEREQLQTLTTIDGDRITITQKMYASIPADKREEAYTWLRENGHEALITEVVNAQTLSAFAKAEIAEGRELPETIFTSFFKPSVSLTKGKETKGAMAGVVT